MKTMETSARKSKRNFYLAFSLAVVTFLLYLPTLDFGFVNYDDNLYVTDNMRVQQGLTWHNVEWAFTTGYASNWHPLTWLSHMTDITLFGMDSGWRHLINVLLHCANTVLLFLVLKGMTDAPWRSAFVAALFALHPLHVESVAWIAERKDVLSTLFWFLAMGAYLSYTRRPGWGRYGVVMLCLALGLMAKAMLVTVPCLLLLLDYWPLKRITFDRSIPWRRGAALILEKVPLLGLSIVASIVAYLVQKAGGAMGLASVLPMKYRIANAFVSYVAYLEKTVWPAGLAVYYPHPRESISMTYAALAAAFIVGVTGAVIVLGRRKPYLPVGWFWYLGTLVPVIGLVQVGGQAMADRYTYVPLVGIFIMVAWGLPGLVPRIMQRRVIVVAATAIVLGLCAWRSHVEIGYWHDSASLFGRTLAVTSNNSMAETAMGNALMNQGRYDEAIVHLKKSLALTPHYVDAHVNLSKVLMLQGKRKAAQDELMRALKIDDSNPKLHNNLGALYAETKQWAKAVVELNRAVALEPTYASAHANLGHALLKTGRPKQALKHFKIALQYMPWRDDALRGLAQAYVGIGDPVHAAEAYGKAVALAPDDASLRLNYAVALAEAGRLDEARRAGEKALQLDPDLKGAQQFLDAVNSAMKKTASQGKAVSKE